MKSAATVGNNRYSRVQGNAAIGSTSDNAGWSNRRGSLGARSNDDDDGSGMAWVKRRREQREREKQERLEKGPADVLVEEDGAEQQGEADAADEADVDTPRAIPTSEEAEQEAKPVLVTTVEEPEHVTQAVKLPAASHSHSLPHSHSHHGRPSMDRVPSYALKHSMERKSSADTARQEHYTSAAIDVVPPSPEVEAVGDMDILVEQDVDDDNVIIAPADVVPRERRESESSANSDSTDEDEDADVEDSMRSEDDDEDTEEEVSSRFYLVGVCMRFYLRTCVLSGAHQANSCRCGRREDQQAQVRLQRYSRYPRCTTWDSTQGQTNLQKFELVYRF